MVIVEEPVRRQPSRWRDLLLAGAIFGAGMAVVSMGRLAVVHPDLFFFAAIGSWLASLITVTLALGWKSVLGTAAVALVSFCALLLPAFTVQDAVLSTRGERITATVVGSDETATGYGDHRVLTLAGPDGTVLPGLLEVPDGVTVGPTVEVVADPAGWVHPKLAADVPEELSPAGGIMVTVIIVALCFGLLMLACFVAIFSERRHPSA
ncbi:hypothetical protein F4553_001184 [Allocatelliglobosispora scoriae]|uniref:Uncharacterized protein n=1 Tax=Allocatelliglobosispora scoriae TaxID=643052 RepID=A0A841BJJ9_9ACTN|nr:hypothetical protein [Allocatelliglobosispora scoriae]MBB5867805.1 hypothetical protein [Allocatelliglobosispora scoriae]